MKGAEMSSAAYTPKRVSKTVRFVPAILLAIFLAIAGSVGVSASAQAATSSGPYLVISGSAPKLGYVNASKACGTGQSMIWGSAPYDVRFAPGKFCLTNGRFKATEQTDGNIVVLDGSHPIWSSRTNGKVGASGFLDFQRDHNLVQYNSSHKPVFATASNRFATNKVQLIMQADGNLVEYRVYNNHEYVDWASNTAGK